MRILGLDPGSRHTGYGIVDDEGEGLRAATLGRLSCPPRAAMPARLHFLARELDGLLDRWRPAAAVLESPFHGINARSLIVLAQARGALLAVLAGRGLAVAEYSPAEVKAAVTGDGRADKEQVARMVRLLLGLDGRASRDATDALALALCYAQRRRMDALAGRLP